MKKSGLSKSILLLSAIPLEYRLNIISHLSLFEKFKLLNKANQYGGFEQIKESISLEKKLYLFNILIDQNKNSITGDSVNFLISFLIFLFGISILVIKIIISGFYDFLLFFSSVGYSTFFTPILLFSLLLKNKFSFKLNFSRFSLLLRHVLEGIIGSIMLFIILMQINAFYPEIILKNYDILFLINGIFFVPILEEMLYRYILMTLILRKQKFIIRIILSSFIFGFFHLPFISFYTFLLYFLAGLILSLLYGLENYLLPSILAHSISNFLIFFI